MGNTPCQHPDGCCPAKNKTNEDSLTNNSSRLTVPRIYKLPLVETTYAQLISQKPVEGSIDDKSENYVPFRIESPDQEAIYVGEQVDGVPHGMGQVYFSNNAFLQSKFIKGKPVSSDAIYIFSDGNNYRGHFSDWQPNGFGVMEIKNESISTGNFVAGVLQGKGTRSYHDGSKYIGCFKNGKKHGKGKLIYPDEATVEGHFQNNLLEGVGHLVTNDYQYWGPFKNNMKEGKGTIKFADGRKFQGWFQSDKIHGYGQLHYPNGRVQKGEYIDSPPLVLQSR